MNPSQTQEIVARTLDEQAAEQLSRAAACEAETGRLLAKREILERLRQRFTPLSTAIQEEIDGSELNDEEKLAGKKCAAKAMILVLNDITALARDVAKDALDKEAEVRVYKAEAKRLSAGAAVHRGIIRQREEQEARLEEERKAAPRKSPQKKNALKKKKAAPRKKKTAERKAT